MNTEAQPIPETAPSIFKPVGRKPTGKIASLPRAQRDIVNQMLDDGATGKAIETEMAKHGVSLNGENISNWFQNGFQQYLRHQDHLAEMRLLRENASDLVQDYNVILFHQAANQLAVGQIFKALTHQQLIDDPVNYVRTLNALSRLSRAALVLKQSEDDSAKTGAKTNQPENPPDPDTQRNLILSVMERGFGCKAAPGPIGPALAESSSSPQPSRESGSASSQPNESAPPTPSPCPSSPSIPSTPRPARTCPADASDSKRSTERESVLHRANTFEHPIPSPIKNRKSKIKNPFPSTPDPRPSCAPPSNNPLIQQSTNPPSEPCPSCFAPLPPLSPSGERVSPHCDNCGISLRPPGALVEYCPHCRHLLPELNSAGQRPTPDCPACLNPLPPPQANPNPPLPNAA